MLYLFDNQIVISIIINIYYPELRLIHHGFLFNRKKCWSVTEHRPKGELLALKVFKSKEIMA